MNTQNINISSNNETTSPRSSSSLFISDGNIDNLLQSIDIFLQDYWNENYDYVEESDLHEPRRRHTIKKLVDTINDSINDQYKDDISEYEHMMQNIMPFIDASIQKVPDYRVRYFESTLQATAIHCNLGGDPTEHARMGYRVDVLIKLPGLHWSRDAKSSVITDYNRFLSVRLRFGFSPRPTG
ncbi:unnamed protein product [Rhizophagus irregularis]|nr:unnamed protein product [Rhizophagus irregularis]